jgi:hypothetical protein
MRVKLGIPDMFRLKEIQSTAAFVVLNSEGSIVSQHAEEGGAARSLAQFVSRNPQTEAAIFRRSAKNWKKY